MVTKTSQTTPRMIWATCTAPTDVLSGNKHLFFFGVRVYTQRKQVMDFSELRGQQEKPPTKEHIAMLEEGLRGKLAQLKRNHWESLLITLV